MIESLSSANLPAPRFSYSLYTTRMDEFPAINAAWESVFTPGQRPPARTSAGVSALPLGAAVEIAFAFYRG